MGLDYIIYERPAAPTGRQSHLENDMSVNNDGAAGPVVGAARGADRQSTQSPVRHYLLGTQSGRAYIDLDRSIGPLYSGE